MALTARQIADCWHNNHQVVGDDQKAAEAVRKFILDDQTSKTYEYPTAAQQAAGTPLKEVQTFSTGAVRGTDCARTPYHMLSPIALRRYANAMADGIEKGYPAHNWLKGFPAGGLIDHLTEHINRFLSGNTTEDHLGHALWNLATLIHFSETMPWLFNELSPAAKVGYYKWYNEHIKQRAGEILECNDTAYYGSGEKPRPTASVLGGDERSKNKGRAHLETKYCTPYKTGRIMERTPSISSEWQEADYDYQRHGSTTQPPVGCTATISPAEAATAEMGEPIELPEASKLQHRNEGGGAPWYWDEKNKCWSLDPTVEQPGKRPCPTVEDAKKILEAAASYKAAEAKGPEIVHNIGVTIRDGSSMQLKDGTVVYWSKANSCYCTRDEKGNLYEYKFDEDEPGEKTEVQIEKEAPWYLFADPKNPPEVETLYMHGYQFTFEDFLSYAKQSYRRAYAKDLESWCGDYIPLYEQMVDYFHAIITSEQDITIDPNKPNEIFCIRGIELLGQQLQEKINAVTQAWLPKPKKVSRVTMFCKDCGQKKTEQNQNGECSQKPGASHLWIESSTSKAAPARVLCESCGNHFYAKDALISVCEPCASKVIMHAKKQPENQA